MKISTDTAKKPTLDKDLDKIVRIEEAAGFVSRGFAGPGLALLFLAAAAIFAALYIGAGQSGLFIVIAAVLGGYMALNIGANDVANNVGPAVGSRALTMVGALLIAAVFESAGALIAGGDVVGTISKGIIDPASVASPDTFIWAMMSALIASALWVNLATIIGAPVSTTHSVVGGVMGAGIAAAGFGAVNWPMMGTIAASWVISPVLGGVIGAMFLAFIKVMIIYRDDKIAAARRWVPVLLAIMAAAFAGYLAMKGLKKVVSLSGWQILAIGAVAGLATYFGTKPLIFRQSEGMENRNQSLRTLFHIPLICSAALLSFAHGANDVANAVGPLAAIVHTAEAGEVLAKVSIPFWVMLIGAAGISIGLVLFGPRLIRMVGEQITRLNPMRAYCVALSAAITVIIASWLGLPVSSTHIAVGAVFGVGFFREWFTSRSSHRREYLARKYERGRKENNQAEAGEQPRRNGMAPEESRRRVLVRRAHFTTIVAAWVITVPAAALLSAATFLVLNTLF
ncbi:inorganic phosphate transporter [Oricola cellulosilytica]|uniref:Phosphate transporter n=1 Tax=Oricola cellulosilytica TaxID=1429082 RepID=A0A4V2MND1_9HYPH|nr:inorganic phosphate transporter [Oricola cellulosilytica]TCD12360.1 inorganic phosphate transporter [Oricola cellulosilytica]